MSHQHQPPGSPPHWGDLSRAKRTARAASSTNIGNRAGGKIE